MKRRKKKPATLKKPKKEKVEERDEIVIKSSSRKKQEKQLRIFIVGMIALLIIVFIMYAFIQSTLKFRYAGLEFEKVRQGDLILYRTETFPIFLREDPRDLRDIDIEDKIILTKKLGIGGSSEIVGICEDSTVAATTLSIFYSNTGLQPFSATRDKEEAEKYNITYIDCGLNADYSAILFEKGDENKIEKEGNCYILETKDCEVMKTAERFIIASYANSRGIEI